MRRTVLMSAENPTGGCEYRMLNFRRVLSFIVLLMSLNVSATVFSKPPEPAKQNPTASLSPLVALLAEVDDPAFQRDVLNGIHKAINGRRDVKMPAGWPRVAQKLAKSPDGNVRRRALEIGVIFGDPLALGTLRKLAVDQKQKPARRAAALQSLVQRRDRKTLAILNQLLGEPSMRSAAIRSLAGFDDPATPQRLLSLYARLSETDKQNVRSTLAARPKYALALLDAIEKKVIPRRDVSAFLIRQITTFNDPNVNRRIERVWGSVRPPKKDRAVLMARYRKILSAELLAKADRKHGRVVFRKTCASCHRLFDDGKRIGPELTGSQRNNIDYLLENVLDPNAVIGRDYRMTAIVTDAGRLITGIVKEESAKTLTLQTANETLIVDKADIELRKQSPVSMMPEGQIEKLSRTDLRDLVAYLMGSSQAKIRTHTGFPFRHSGLSLMNLTYVQRFRMELQFADVWLPEVKLPENYFWVDCIYDPKGQNGSAAVLSDLITRGAGDLDTKQLSAALDNLGLQRHESVGNVFTTFTGATLAENLAPAIRVYGTIVRNPALPADQFDAARAGVEQTLRAMEDEPRQKVIQELRRHCYNDPWGRPTDGSLEDLPSLSADSVRKHFETCYRPNGAILGIAGKVDVAAITALVDEVFGDWEQKPDPVFETGPRGTAFEHIDHDSTQTHIGIAYNAIPYRDPDYYAAWAAVSILSGGMSSRLFTEVREKRGLCYAISASLTSLRDEARVLCYAGTTTERAQETLDVTLVELARLAEGIEQDELDRCKARAKSSLIMQQESTIARSSAIARDWYHLGRINTLDDVGRKIDAFHFLEHMAFKGNDKYSADDVNRIFDEIGAKYNASTSEEVTLFYGAVLPEYLPQAFEMLSTLIFPSLRQDDFDMEKNVILEEIGMYEDQPAFTAYETVMQAHFHGHPLGQSILGTSDSITALTSEQMRQYHREHYTANNFVLALAGRADWDDVLKLAEQHCGEWPSGEVLRETPEAQPTGGMKIITKESAIQQHVMQMAAAPPADNRLRYAAEMLSVIVGDDSGSRMFWDIVDPGYAEAAEVGYNEYDGSGTYLTYLSCDPDSAAENLERIAAIYADVNKNGVDDSEIELARNKVASRVVLRSERPMGRLSSLGSNWVYRKEYRSVADDMQTLRSISSDDIRELLEAYPLAQTTTAAVGPLTSINGG
eukprot:g10231.t1